MFKKILEKLFSQTSPNDEPSQGPRILYAKKEFEKEDMGVLEGIPQGNDTQEQEEPSPLGDTGIFKTFNFETNYERLSEEDEKKMNELLGLKN